MNAYCSLLSAVYLFNAVDDSARQMPDIQIMQRFSTHDGKMLTKITVMIPASAPSNNEAHTRAGKKLSQLRKSPMVKPSPTFAGPKIPQPFSDSYASW